MTQKDRDYYSSCGIKAAWHDKTLKDFVNDSEAKRKVLKYLSQDKIRIRKGPGLYLWGANGSGKSHLMNCSFMRLINEGYKVRVFSMDEIVDKFTSSWYSDEQKLDLDNVLRNIDVLGIDEFGKNIDKKGEPTYLPDLVKRVMESIIRFRVQMNKPMWFASNTEPEYVKKVFSEDIASLMKEAVIPIVVKGRDYREVIFDKNQDIL